MDIDINLAYSSLHRNYRKRRNPYSALPPTSYRRNPERASSALRTHLEDDRKPI